MFDIGIVVGKFAPLTIGHINLITQASLQAKKVIVVLSHDNRWLARQSERDQKVLSFKNRLRWLQQHYADIDHVDIQYIIEDDIPEFPNGWNMYCQRLRTIYTNELHEQHRSKADQFVDSMSRVASTVAIFSSELDYDKGYEEYLPEISHVVVDPARTAIPISATKIRENLYENWNYLPSLVRKDYTRRVVVIGQESCVDSETEYFNGVQWKKISDYKEGDKVLQFNDDRTASLVFPERYIKELCSEFWEIKNTYDTWSQVYTEDHELVYENRKGKLIKKKVSDVIKTHFNTERGFEGKFIPIFNFDGEVNYDEARLRLMIAISADGSLSRSQKFWRVNLKKRRKINRLRYLLESADIKVDERNYANEYTVFFIPVEYGVKEFPSDFYNLSKRSKEIFVEEIFFWDGSNFDSRKYFSTIKHNIDIAQFILSSSGIKTSIKTDVRPERSVCYTLIALAGRSLTISMNSETTKCREKIISKTISKDGNKYCFTVPSGMLVLRRKNHIFITGNCGKSSLVKNLAKMFNTSWVEEYGRTYCLTELAGSESTLRSDDYPIIAYRHKELEIQALRTANRICLVDTNAFITEYYHRLYEGRPNEVVSAIARNERYDLVIVLEPTVPWVADGLRSNENRTTTTELFKEMKKEFPNQFPPDRTFVISSPDYKKRFDEVYTIINEYLSDVNKGNA